MRAKYPRAVVGQQDGLSLRLQALQQLMYIRLPLLVQPLKGSSSIRISGSSMMAWAMARRWVMPREYFPTCFLLSGSRPTRRITSSIRWLTGFAADIRQQGQVLPGAVMVQKAGVFDDDAGGRREIYIFADHLIKNCDSPLCGFRKTADTAHQRGLAAAVFTDQADDGAGGK